MSERRKHLEFLRKTAKEAIWSGDYERALTLYDDGLSLARAWKDRDLEDLFTCNRATTLIEMDRQDFDLSRLKEILLRSPSSFNGVLAAYVSANAHEARGEFERARFYAQAALAKSRELGLEELTGTSLNLLANLELHEGRFEAARDLFPEAVERLESEGESSRARPPSPRTIWATATSRSTASTSASRSSAARSSSSKAWARARRWTTRPRPVLRHVKGAWTRPRAGASRRSGSARSSAGKTSSRTRTICWPRRTAKWAGRRGGRAVRRPGGLLPDFPALKNYLRQISLMEVINLRA